MPTGNFAVDVKVFTGGDLAARTNTAMQVIKAGLEQYAAEAASDLVFRRD